MAVPTIQDVLARAGFPACGGDRVVLRKDFSNVIYIVAKDLSEAAASFLAGHFNDLGHHQFYWTERPTFDPRQFEPGDIVPARALESPHD